MHGGGLLFRLGFLTNRGFSLVVIALALRFFAILVLARGSMVENLVFCQNLVLWDINLLEAFIIKVSALRLMDDMSPLLIVSIDQILNLEPNSRLQSLTLAVIKKTVANRICVLQVDNFVAPLLLIFQILLRLFAKVDHKLIHHVTHDFDILIIDLLL